MREPIEKRLEALHQLYPVWEKKTIWDFFTAAAERFPENDHIVMQGQCAYTYAQTRAAALRLAAGLRRFGIGPGDHVAIQMENSPEQIFLALALAALRAVKVPINTALGTREMSYVIRQSQSVFLITNCKIHLPEDCSGIKRVFLAPRGVCEATVPVITWNRLFTEGAEDTLPESGARYADEPSDIIYTSGSTSAPKGVLLTHDMLMRSAYASCCSRGFELGRRIFIPLPMFHIYGYVEGFLAATLVGGAVLIRRGKFLADQALDFMLQAAANDILSVPAQMMAVIKELKHNPRVFPQLHAVYCSASVCPAWVWPDIRKYLGVHDVITGYGMSEVSGASMQTRPGDSDQILRTRVGKLLPAGCAGHPEYGGYQMEYKVVDRETGQDCPPGDIGELWCRGTVVTKGYFNLPEINARVFTADGWFRTGDCGWFDKDGYLQLSGRMDDMYKINGENVSPKFLEDVLGDCPVINNVEIVGIPDEKHGYVGVAFIQLHEDTPENRTMAEKYSQLHLAKFQVPKYFVYMRDTDWPRTSTGKVQKFRLREKAADYAHASGL